MATAVHSSSRRTVQRTLAGEARVEGVGLFSGVVARVSVRPAPAGHGVVFALPHGGAVVRVAAVTGHVLARPRRTAIGAGGASVETIEHLMSALAGLEIDNALVEVDGPEVPAGDGSALAFVEAIARAGVRELDVPRERLECADPLRVDDGDASIEYQPPAAGGEHRLVLGYELGFAGPSPIPAQAFSCELTPEVYARDVAPARTFSSEVEARAAAAMGLFRHLTPRDMLVIGESGPIDNAYRFENEPARHKLLDLLGDLYLAGGLIAGRVRAVRSGHALNQRMAALIRERAIQVEP